MEEDSEWNFAYYERSDAYRRHIKAAWQWSDPWIFAEIIANALCNSEAW